MCNICVYIYTCMCVICVDMCGVLGMLVYFPRAQEDSLRTTKC